MRTVPVAVQGFDLYAGVTLGSMNKHAGADINACVVTAVTTAECHDITGPHLGNVPDFEAHGRLFLGRAGQFHSGPPVSPLNQSGAVETSRMFASPDIGCSEGVMGTSQDLS